LLKHLKVGSPSYGHLRLFVQALAFAAALAMIPHAAAARTLRLVALGDSLTAGLGAPVSRLRIGRARMSETSVL